MRTGVVLTNGCVMAMGDNYTIPEHHRTDRYFTCSTGQRRLGQSQLHGLLVSHWLGAYSHSMVAGGLLLTSYVTRLMPRTSLMTRLDTFFNKA